MEPRDKSIDDKTDRVLASKVDLGAVKRLRSGVIEIAFEGQAMRMSVARYWTFMEMSVAAICPRTIVRLGVYLCQKAGR